ncbi:MAG: ATP-dependent DNA helicase RecG [Clostridiales bacterium]|nr:ATP-dependent DNA helicase RecG [Clostridiales bacterium]
MRLEEIKGFGVKRIQKLNEAGLSNPSDLLMIFPSKYVFRDSKISDFAVGEEAAVVAECASEPVTKFIRKGLSFVRAVFAQGENEFECIWFNQPYVKKQIIANKTYAIIGKIKSVGKKTQIYVSAFSGVDGDDDIITIYKAYNGIPAKILKEAIAQVLNNVTIQGQISDDFCVKNDILPLNYCIRTLHRPQNREDLYNSKFYAALQILAFNIAAFLQLKGLNSQNKENKYQDNYATLQKVMSSLPYKLTSDQLNAVEEIVRDMHSDKKMNRLLEGDVGCGKTIVAFLAMYYAVMSGYQAALMAPTEILAQQHYAKALDFFGPNIKCELLCGSQSKDRRLEALFNIQTGNAQIIIGTHSIFQDSVVFNNLALTIADEQQRFGVEQRGNFENKGKNVDSLVMSATPIPRTLALTLYGDLDVSLIKSMPQSKAKIFTKLVPKQKEKDMFDYICRKASEGEKSYVVCPRVDDEESISVTKVYSYLHKKYGNIVGLVHGQMKDEDKNKIMRAFASGTIKILVSTTVIEVGVDVPDAINIIIFDAEAYGLSQLHQLRGRVGRGTKDSYCFVISKGDKPDNRLDYFIKTNNGFELAEYDFKMRGAGDFLGKRQHGNDSIFADVSINETLLSRAKELADELVASGEAKVTAKSFNYIKGLTLN